MSDSKVNFGKVCNHGSLERQCPMCEMQGQILELEYRNAKLVEALKLILPMAKGYAYEHPVGSNQQIVSNVESAFREQEE